VPTAAKSNVLPFKPKSSKGRLLELGKSATIDAMSANVMIADADHNILYMNDALIEFLRKYEKNLRAELPHFSVDNLIGQNIDAFHKNPSHQRKMLDGKTEPYDTSIRIGDVTFIVTIAPLYNPRGSRIGTSVIWIDSKDAIENVSMVNAINRSQGVIHFELDGTITDANPNFLSVVGYSLHEVKGKHHSMFVERDYARSAEYKEFWRNLAAGQHQSGQYKRIAKGGKEVWIEASYNPIFDFHGKPYKVTKFATDLTPRKEANRSLADVFEGNVSVLVDGVAGSARQMDGTAQTLASGADDTSRKASVVAAATEELSASVNEISAQVGESARVVGEAVSDASEAERLVTSLVEAASKIGEVTEIIADIANQTNLLALNATIEAARAGDAGKGFAVVATEVKTLATQTAQATEEIRAQIGGIQSVSSNTAVAIRKISDVIEKVNQSSTAISSAVEEQAAATREVSENIASVQESASGTGTSASEVLDVANTLAKQSDDLKSRVIEFLQRVRSM